MIDYDAMSDFEISCCVAEIIYGIDKSEMKEFVYANKKSAPVWENSWDGLKSFDINNPSDMMPIVFENEISLIRDVSTNDVWCAIGKGWFTYDGFESNLGFDCEVVNKDPLRAAAICFLKMQEWK